jgi:alanyl-tRNA synthetase
VRQTGDIGAFVTLGDSASSAGVRRIEALTGAEAMSYLREQDIRLAEVSLELKAQPADVLDRVRNLMEERRALGNELAQLRRELAMAGGGSSSAPEARDIGGIPFMAQVMSGVTGRDLPALVDQFKEKLGTGAVLLIADADGKAAVAAGVTKDLTGNLSAVDIVKAAVAALGGKGGGGRPDMAQGGAKDASNADAAITAAEKVIGG